MIKRYKLKTKNKEWIVLYTNGGRIGSFKKSDLMLKILKTKFNMSLIQEDITGTLHYNVFYVNKKKGD